MIEELTKLPSDEGQETVLYKPESLSGSETNYTASPFKRKTQQDR